MIARILHALRLCKKRRLGYPCQGRSNYAECR
jgi:hypothetical protein